MSTTRKSCAPMALLFNTEEKQQARGGTTRKRALAAISIKPHSVSFQRDIRSQSLEESHVATEETVTLSPVSSSLSSVLNGSLSPSPLGLPCDTTTTTTTTTVPVATVVETRVEPLLLLSEKVRKESESFAERNLLIDTQWSEQMLRYFEAVRLLQQASGDIEGQEQFLQSEIQRQRALYVEIKSEFDKKKEAYKRLKESTLRLTRHVRSLDSENDRMRDRLTQLRTTVEKALSRKLPRYVRPHVHPIKSNKQAISTRQHITGHKKDVVVAPVTLQRSSSSSSIADSLTAGFEACNRKLRLAEKQHKKILNELQLAVARKKGRVAAYGIAPIEYIGQFNGEDSFSNNTAEEAAVIRQLERMIDNSLLRFE